MMSQIIQYPIFLFILIFWACKNDKPSETTGDPSFDTPKFEMVANAEPEPEPTVESSEVDTIQVSDLASLVEHAKDNRVLLLKGGEYRMKSNLVYYITKNEHRVIDKSAEETMSLGGQLYISGLTNFQILAEGNATFLSENPLAIPLFVIKSKKIVLKNLTFGHKLKSSETCEVPTSYIANVNDITFDKCIMNGKGKIGMNLLDVVRLRYNGGQITNGSNGLINILNSTRINFENTLFDKSRSKMAGISIFGTGSEVAFSEVNISNNIAEVNPSGSYSNLFSIGPNLLTLSNSVVKNNKNFTQLGLPEAMVIGCEIDNLDY